MEIFMKLVHLFLPVVGLQSCVLLCSPTLVTASTVVVDSPFGKIQGVRNIDEITGLSYLTFKGIPYAKPPLGDLRFTKPQPHPKIDGIFDATKDDLIVCPHLDILTFGISDFTEDCLILNIQMKDNTNTNTLQKVIVYVHGGSFKFGTSSFQESKSFVISQNVIVVTMNYRLGILGFLSLENEASLGNYGLWDQTLAIKWVKDNIRAFGGDPDDIMIAGESAGGVSVGFQALSPHTKGLFTKAFLQSGTATANFVLCTNAQSHALTFAKSSGCWEGDVHSKINIQQSRNVMDCLRKLPLPKITSINIFNVSDPQFVPVIDNDFVPDVASKLIQDNDYLDSIGFYDRTYLASVVNNEIGLVETVFNNIVKNNIFMEKDLTLEEKESKFQRFLTDCKKLLLKRLGESASKNEYIVNRIDDFYDRRYSKNNALIEFFQDLNFIIPSLDFLIAASKRESCSSYFLYFNHFPNFMKGSQKGTPHEADLAYWFDFDLQFVEDFVQAGIQPGLFDDDDLEIKRMFCNIIGEFAKSGNPGLALKDIIPSGWPKYDVTTSKYLNFNLKPWIGSFLEKEKQDFWFNTIPNLMSSVESSTVVVDTPFGKIQGAKKTDELSGLSYLSFKGIPYAKPPLGDLRFAKPQPHPKIPGVFDASKDKKIFCPHPSMMTLNETDFSEDCLILNIQTKDINPSYGLKKVVVFIHGGGFISGTSAYYQSASFITNHDIIVVTINYRLGILGFLSTENEASPGNYGLWDQSLAIKWVKDNIRAFGGDPDDLTIAGESAGGASVGYQSLSPHSKGLFTKAYPHSGAATTVFGLSLNAQSHALEIAKSTGCWEKDVPTTISVQESKALIDCLRKVPISVFSEFNYFTTSKTNFVPTVDGDFIPDIPSKLLQDDAYLDSIGFFDRSYMFGLNRNEKALLQTFMQMTKYAIFANEQMSEEEKKSIYEKLIADAYDLYMLSRLGEVAASDKDIIISKIESFYHKRYTDDDILIELLADLNFVIPTFDFLAAASRRELCISYLLYFDHFPHYMKGQHKGSVHGIDLLYWFDIKVSLAEKLLKAGMQGEFDEEDFELKRLFSSIVADFIKTGNPGVTLKLKNIIPSGWPRFDTTNSYYLDFNSKPWIGSFLEKEKQDLWMKTVPGLMKKAHVHYEL